MGSVNNYSPLRYPGGKAAITDFFIKLLDANHIKNTGTYCEPFAGGAGVALTLLLKKRVGNIIINDFDPCIAAFWHSVLHETKKFIEAIESVNIDIETWKIKRQIYEDFKNRKELSSKQQFELGFATFFLNRCNRAGILPKAGPIGGIQQSGKYKIDARFKKQVLIQRIEQIAVYKNCIRFYSMDAMDFLTFLKKDLQDPENTFIYLDPPYFLRGSQLYLNYYKVEDHAKLAKILEGFDVCRWVMTYDDCNEIRSLYQNLENITITSFPIQYSMQHVRKATEALIYPAITEGLS